MGGRSATDVHNIPRQTTTFVGREDDLAELRELIAERELVTITGPGGTGKTRLGMELAVDCADLFPDGIWSVELASLSEPDLVARTIAESVGLRTTTADPLEDVVARIAGRDTLIVLDNCEHLLDACAGAVETLMRGTSDAHILATSREPLHVRGETEFRVTPLSLPDPEDDLERVAEAEAVRLFCERAARTRRGFALTDAEAQSVVAICRALDGMPLAIELAAARAGVLSTSDIATRVRERTDFLVSRERSVVDRQRTLDACIGWSYDLLTDDERSVFRSLSAFAGDFSASDAQEVCDERLDVDALLEALVERSIVEVASAGDETRFSMLETIRAFAASKAVEHGEDDRNAERLLAWARGLVRDGQGRFDGPDGAVWLERLERANDDLRRALAWGLEHDPASTSELAAGLAKFWIRRGQLSEGRHWLETFLATPSGPAVRIRMLQALADIESEIGDQRAARVHYTDAVAIARDAADRQALVRLLGRVGELERTEGRYDEGRAVLDEALEIARELADETLLIETEFYIASIDLLQARIDAAGTRFEHLRARLAAMDDPRREALMIHACGFVEQLKGNLRLAARHYEDALEMRRRVGDRVHVLNSLIQLADVERARGSIEAAEQHAQEAYRTARDMGAVDPLASSLSLLAMVAHARGDLRTARGLRHEAATVSKRLGPAYHAYNLGEVAALDGLLGRYEDAERGLREAADVFTSIDDVGHAAEMLATLADLELALGRDGDAELHLDEAEEHAGESTPLRAQLQLARAELLRRAGNLAEARVCLDGAAELAEQMGAEPLAVAVAQMRAALDRDAGAVDDAAGHLQEAIDLARRIGARHRFTELVEDAALLAGARAAHRAAMRLCGAAERLRESTGAALAPARAAELAAIEAGALEQIGRDAVESAWASGRTLSESRALDQVLHDDDVDDAAAVVEVRPPPSADPTSAFATLVREGDYWTIETGSSVVRIKDAVGMRYLVHLLDRPGNEFHVFELVAVIHGGSAASVAEPDLRLDARDGIDVIDPAARDAYRARIEELRGDIEQAEEWSDTERAAGLRAELDALVEQLASAYGLGGRARETSSDANRARVAVTKAIRTSVRRITEAAPELGEHLGRAVRTGAFCSYAADPLRPIVVR